MKAHNLSGLLMILAAGAMNGSFAVPMKWMHSWAWENMWLAWSLVGLIFLPLLFTSATVPHVLDVYGQSSAGVLFWVTASGFAWGASQVLFGLGIKRVGMALGFAIVVGVAAATGSLFPLFYLEKGESYEGWPLLVGGILVLLLGVSLCAFAGHMRESKDERSGSSSWTGIMICIIAGVGGSMINIGMVAGSSLSKLAALQGALAFYRTNSIWLPLLASGFVATSVYCGWLLTNHNTWRSFTAPGALSCWLLAAVMAVSWFGSIELYGAAALKLDRLGPALGWPIFLSTSILTANAWGLAVGEWRQALLRPRRLMLTGVTVLIVAIFLIGLAGQFHGRQN